MKSFVKEDRARDGPIVLSTDCTSCGVLNYLFQTPIDTVTTLKSQQSLLCYAMNLSSLAWHGGACKVGHSGSKAFTKLNLDFHKVVNQ